MNLYSLRTITWGTVAGAVISALLLAGIESGLPDGSRTSPKGSAAFALPSEPTGAGPQRKTAAEAKARKTSNQVAKRAAP